MSIVTSQQTSCGAGTPVGPKRPTGATPRTYVYASYVDEPVMLIDRTAAGAVGAGTDERFFYHRNQQYSVTALSDAAGAVVERYAYTAYGEPTILDGAGTTTRTASALGNPYLYTARAYDAETGLYYFRARMYEGRKGRFLSHDPIMYPNGMNAFAAWFAPQSTDPTGKIAPLVYVVGSAFLYKCACLYHTNKAQSTYNCQPMSAEQRNCYWSAAKIIDEAVGGKFWQGVEQPGYVRGDGGGNYSMTYAAPGCGSWTFYAASDLDCSTCDKFANTLASVYHENNHGLGTKHPETYCNEAKFLKEKLLPMCKKGFGPCKKQAECEKAVNEQLDIANKACNEGGDGDI